MEEIDHRQQKMYNSQNLLQRNYSVVLLLDSHATPTNMKEKILDYPSPGYI